MVAKPETLNRFIFNSDYPMDKIIWLNEGQTTTGAVGNDKIIEIDVQTQFNSKWPIFVKGAYTFDDWASSIMVGATHSATTTPAKYVLTYLMWSSGKVRLTFSTNNSGGANKSVKYRLWGVQRDDIDFAVDYPKNSSINKSKLIFNSDNNYPRIYKEGVAMTGDVIQHDLQRIPFVDYWHVTGSQTPNSLTSLWTYAPYGGLRTSGTFNMPTVKATNTTIEFTKSGSSDVYYYYRIYA